MLLFHFATKLKEVRIYQFGTQPHFAIFIVIGRLLNYYIIMSITQNSDFKNNGQFILRINDCSIWYKDQRAMQDADYYVLIDYRGRQIYRGETVATLIGTALNTPNRRRKTPKKLTSIQRKKITPILRKYKESIRDV